MTFFDNEPPFTEPQLPPRRSRESWERPDFALPGTAPGHLLLLRTDTVAVSVGSLRAYPNGFEFTLHTRKRPTGEPRPARARPEFLDPFAWNRRGENPEHRFQLGLLYADGRRAFGQGTPRDPDRDPEDVAIRSMGGRGSDHTWDGDYWVHPLPPSGPLLFVASWPAHGVAEVRAELDADALHRAAAEAVELWPEEPDFPDTGGYTRSTTRLAVKGDDRAADS